MEIGELPQAKKFFREIVKRFTRKGETEKPEFVPAPQPEKAEELERFVLGGLELIKSSQYSLAISYFDNSKETEKLGVRNTQDATHVFIDIKNLPILTPDKTREIIDELARHFHFYPPENKEDLPAIKLSNIIIVNPDDSKGVFLLGEELPEGLASQIPTVLYHNIALLYCEEWLHILQFLRGNQPIAGYKNNEIDVAAYLQNQGVPLTDEFLARYQRRQVLFEGEPPPTIPIA